MGSKTNIIPGGIASSSNNCGIFNSRQYYKGTSFKMSGEWTIDTNYFNDEYIVDFIAYGGALLSCTKSHISTNENKPVLIKNEEGEVTGIQQSDYWTFVLAGIPGPEGSVWEPSYNSGTGTLTWSLVDTPTNPGGMNIRGPQGVPGKDGKDGDTPVIGVKKNIDGLYYWTVNGNWLLSPEYTKILAQGLKGDPGAPGKQGETGPQGNTPILQVNKDGLLQVSYDNGKTWSLIGNIKGDPGKQGPKGDTGQSGITPQLRMLGENLQVSYNGYQWISLGRVVGARGPEGQRGEKGDAGEDGTTPVLRIKDTNWEVSYNQGASWELVGKAIGPQGVPGRSPKLQVVWGDPDSQYDDRIIWGYDGVPMSEWATLCYLSELRGDSIQSVDITDKEGTLEMTMTSGRKVTSTGSVLPRFNTGTTKTLEWDQDAIVTIDKTNAPREWALNVEIPKGKPATVTVIESVEKLAPDAQPYVTDLNPSISDANLKFGIPQGEKGEPGDQNIHIGCFTPSNLSQIWYDPCDEAMDYYSANDFLYEAYLKIVEDTGVTGLSKLDFEKAFSMIGLTTTGLKLQFVKDVASLPNLEEMTDLEIRSLLGTIFLIPNQEPATNNIYEEYVIIEGPIANTFHCEMLGSNEIRVILEDYYTKENIDTFLSQKVDYYNDHNIKLDNDKSLLGTTTNELTVNLIGLSDTNTIEVGSVSIPLSFNSSARPTITINSESQQVAYLSEINAAESEIADIKQALTVVKVTA